MSLTPISVNELSDVISATQVSCDKTAVVTGMATDHRFVQPGDAFVAFVGQRVDGHDFVEEAWNRGASVAIVSKPVKTSTGEALLVKDPLKAVQALAIRERSLFTGPVIGVTGSNGKTTTKQMIAAILEGLGPCLYTPANQNNELGLPKTILQRKPEHRAIVLEMGMRGMGEIATLSAISRPTIGVITNIGQSHMERLGSQEAIAQAKGELLESLSSDGHAVLNADDPWQQRISSKSRASIVWYGFHADADVRASDVMWTETGMQFVVTNGSHQATIRIPTFGYHNVANALAAIAVGLLVDLDLVTMADQLRHLQELDGRLRLKQGHRNIRIIDDCYNASPLSMKASLQVLEHLAASPKRAAILGDMYELGEMNERGHRQVGLYAAEAGVDSLICVGEAAKWIAEEALRCGVQHVHLVQTVEEALAELEAWIPVESTVLVKASRGMELERLVSRLSD